MNFRLWHACWDMGNKVVILLRVYWESVRRTVAWNVRASDRKCVKRTEKEILYKKSKKVLAFSRAMC